MATWSFVKIDYFPKALALSLTFALLSALIIAVFTQDCSIYLPYISEAGAKPPASRIFGIFLNITAFFCTTTIILRYMIIEVWDRGEDKCIHRVNVIALIYGLLSMLGMSTVAAFPLKSIWELHFFGAFMLFGFSMVYGFLQAWISYKFYPTFNSLFICRLRLGIMLLCTLTSCIILVSGAVGFSLFGPSSPNHWSGKKTPNDEGFFYLFLSSLAEWLQTVCFIMFYLTLVPEFQKVTVHVNVQYSNSVLEENSYMQNGTMKAKVL